MTIDWFLIEFCCIEIRDKAKWEKLIQPSYQETLASDLAGATILDQRNYLDELEHIISNETSHG